VSASSTDEALLEDAFDWLIRRQEAECVADVDAALQVWLQRSSAHQRAWQKACRSWQVLGDIEMQRAVPPVPPVLVRRPRRRRLTTGISLAACLLLAVLSLPLLLQNSADFETGTGERRQVTLDDGSVVELGAETSIDIAMSATGRSVTLLKGEAFFDVVKDPARPFTVTAGETEIRVIGTAFDVDYRQDETVVQLERGQVSVKGSGHGGLSLLPGEMVSVRPKDGTITKGIVDTADIGAWRQGRLFVEDQSIASVVEILQRHHKGFIRIASNDLASRRVTGSYDLSDPDKALSALVEAHGGTVYRLSPYLRVLVGS
jgi:ferric-dicitrate binding protein FerR (iron transport regulator)